MEVDEVLCKRTWSSKTLLAASIIGEREALFELFGQTIRHACVAEAEAREFVRIREEDKSLVRDFRIDLDRA